MTASRKTVVIDSAALSTPFFAMKRPLLFSAAFAGLFAMLPLPSSGQEMRIWKDKSGRPLEAEMTGVDVAAAAVKLRRKDGSEVSVPIAILSDEDVAYAKTVWQQMQSGAAPAAPPADAPAAPAPAAAPSGQPAPPRPELTVTPAAKFKIPAAADYLRSVPRTRPRLIHADAGWKYLADQAQTNATAGQLLARVKESAEKLMEAPELTRIFGEQRSRVTPGSKALYRLSHLGLLHRLDKDPRWLDRGARELAALCDTTSFADWYAAQPSVAADFIIGVCLGYDWLHDGLNKQQAEATRASIVERGILPMVAFLDKKLANKDAADQPPDPEVFAASAALIIAALCISDEDPAAAKKAVGAAAKPFGRGMTRFAPAGLWPEGLDESEQALDYGIMVLQSLKACSGGDFGFSLLEGFVRAGDARLHLAGPLNQIFNYGDSESAVLTAPWVGTWLSGAHGNPGLPALAPGPAQGPDSAFLGQAGHLLYFNPHAAGYGTPSGLDAVFPGAEVAAMRSAWNDKNAFYLAIKGGDTGLQRTQLDLGTFILDAGGQRWAIELGRENDRGPGMSNPADRARRFGNYRQGSAGQNVLVTPAGNQAFDVQAAVTGFVSTPERAAAVIDLKAAYSRETRDYQRGALLARGAATYAVIQDEIAVKGTQTFTWSMHTRATVEVNGNKALLTQGKQTLTAVILSPEGAVFTTEAAPEQTTPLTSLRGVNVLKTTLDGAQGEQRLTVAFALGSEPPQAPVLPLAEWLPKK